MAWRDEAVRDKVIRTILGEAGGEGPDGMAAVAHVMKNRADSGAWGDRTNGGLTRVITAPLQFSVWNDGKQPAQGILPNDPRYQRAGAIADAVFSEQHADNTGGATHYYAPAGMPGGRAPDWAVGPGQQIGTQRFYKLPLNASNTAGTAVTSPSMVGVGQSAAAPAPAAQPAPSVAEIAPIQSFTGGDYGRQATAGAQPFKGIVIHIAGKPDLQSELAYNKTPDATRGNAYYGYHYLVDRDGKVYQTAPDDVRTNHIMGNAKYGLNNENAIGVSFIGGAPAGKNPLPMTPEQQAAGIALVNQLKAKYNIDPSKIVSHGELDNSRIQGLNPDGGAEGLDFIKAYRANPTGMPAPATAAAPAVNPDAPAPQAQPVAAVAPPGASPIPGPAASPSAGFVGPGSDKVSLVESMTSGTSHNPQLTTAAKWGSLFGGGSPAPPAATPAATAPSSQPGPDLHQRAPLAQTPLPPVRPADTSAPAPVRPADTSAPAPVSNAWNQRPSGVSPSIAGAPLPPERPMALPSLSTADLGAPTRPTTAPQSLLSGLFGASNSIDPDTLPNTGGVPGGGVTGRAPMTAGAPSMGFPAMSNPFGQPAASQVSQLPGSMMASAQNLIKALFG